MTHLCCPRCRLRFSPAAGAYLVACPECGELPQSSSLEATVGFRMFRLEHGANSLPEAVAVSLLIPEPGGARS
jgi:hypothetical protein